MTQKSLGQIAWEVDIDPRSIQWDKAYEEEYEEEREYFERIAQAVAKAERERVCAWLRSSNNGSIAGSACLHVAALAIESEYTNDSAQEPKL